MAEGAVFCITLLFVVNSLKASFVFHENTKIIFQPEYDAEYFGYSTILSPDGLLVGAPKAQDPDDRTGIKPGTVFNCSLINLDIKNVSCSPLKRTGRSGYENAFSRMPGIVRDDMWIGATMALLSNGRLLVNAPRWTTPYGKKHLLMNGVSFLQSTKGNRVLYPLKDYNRQAFVTNGSRREYGEYGTHLNYYAYGEAGASVAVTKMNSVIIGAPGLLQWTGGIISMTFFPDDTSTYMNKLPTANPYLTKDIGPDDYFGYSVDSGVFQRNGSVLYVAGAPRFNIASGQVLIFDPPTQEMKALTVKAKIRGPQSGSYFGASLCCTDINGDGLDDILVGAPTYVKNDGGLPYDQGAVFVYLTKEEDSKFIFEEYGHVSGSGTNGAWFGISVADLGDIDGDGFRDIAVGAPWEDDGAGAVYVYKGYAKGLNTNTVQRIQPEGALGFGWSIAKGADVDQNNCSDLAIGAHNSQTSYLYRCIPTMTVHASINVRNAINLPQNTTSFPAKFCVSAPTMRSWPHVEINMIARIDVDPEYNRAMLSGDSKYTVNVKPGKEICDELDIEVNSRARVLCKRSRLCDPVMMSVDTIKCANCNVVISEVLAFIRDKHDVMDNESLIRICVSAFTEEEIDKAKNLLCSTTKIGKRLKSRRKDKKQKDLEDMIAVFKTMDPDQLPVFVAYELHKLPPVCFDHVDVTKLLKDLLILRAELNDIKHNFVTKDDLDVALKENNVIQSSASQLVNPIFNTNVNKIRGGGYNMNSGPFGLSPHLPSQCSQLIDADSLSQTQLNSVDNGPKYRSLVHSHERVLPAGDESSTTPVNSTFVENANYTNTNLIQSTQSNKTMVEVLMQGEWPKNSSKDEWTLVQNKRSKNRFEGKTGTASPNANFKFRAADSKIPLFITNVNKETTEKDICDYIQNKTQEIVQLQKINMKSERPYNAFKLFVTKHKLNKFLDDKIWPEGIRFRQFIYFKKNVKKVNKQYSVENLSKI